MVRELPQRSALDRIQTTLRKYGILSSDKSAETDGQALIEEALNQRAIALRGKVVLGLLIKNLLLLNFIFLFKKN